MPPLFTGKRYIKNHYNLHSYSTRGLALTLTHSHTLTLTPNTRNQTLNCTQINDVIDFATSNLDLTSYVRGPIDPEAPPVYDLFAVSEHIGGMGGGHYTAKCLNEVDQKWYSFNDSTVSPTTASAAVSGSAYVLFHRRSAGSCQPLALPGDGA
jgi:hypothetical protein